MSVSSPSERRRADLALLGSQIQVAVAVLSVPVGLLGVAAGMGAVTMLSYYLTFGAVLIVGGAVLLVCAYRPLRLSLWQWAVVVGAAVVGTAASLLLRRESGGGLFVYTVYSGYPFDFVASSASFETVVPAAVAQEFMRANPGAVRSTFQSVPMLVDAVFWGYVGLLVLIPVRQLVRLVRRGRERPEQEHPERDRPERNRPEQNRPEQEHPERDRPGQEAGATDAPESAGGATAGEEPVPA